VGVVSQFVVSYYHEGTSFIKEVEARDSIWALMNALWPVTVWKLEDFLRCRACGQLSQSVDEARAHVTQHLDSQE
jgi:hypothetical protein